MAKRPKKRIGNLERRGNSFRVRLSVAGRRHYFTVRTDDPEAARRAAQARHEELTKAAERQSLGLPGEMPFSALLAEFEAIELPDLSLGARRSYRDCFKPFRTYFVEKAGDPPISQIRSADVREYLAWRRVNRRPNGGTVSAHTVAMDRRALHRLFSLAFTMEYIDANPVTRVRAPKGDRRTPHILDEEEYGRLLAACAHDPMLHTYVTLLGETGMRAFSEALWLRWEDIDIAEGFVHIVTVGTGTAQRPGEAAGFLSLPCSAGRLNAT